MFGSLEVVTNLPPDAVAQYKRVVASKTKPEKLKNLRLFLSMIPGHKGTEKLRVNVKRQITRLEEGMERDRVRRRQARRQRALSISKGKDELLLLLLYGSIERRYAVLSKVSGSSSIGFYSDAVKPHSIRLGGVNTIFLPMNLSLVASSDYLDLVKQADVALFVVSSEEELRGYGAVANELKRFGVYFVCPSSETKMAPSPTKSVEVKGQSDFVDHRDALDHVKRAELGGVIVEISKFSTIYSLDACLSANAFIIKFWVLLSDELRTSLGEVFLLDGSIPSLGKTLSEIGDDPQALLHDILRVTGKMRVWTKEPREKEVPGDPVLLHEGDTVLDLARSIHGELAMELKYAVVYRPSEHAASVRVGSGFELRDGDIVEIH